MKAKVIERKMIGKIDVDSGQVMVGDPCYLSDWIDNDFDVRTKPDPEEFSYNQACHATTSEYQAGVVAGKAIASSTMWGDGSYPVYIEYNQKNEPLRMIIEFEYDEEDEDE